MIYIQKITLSSHFKCRDIWKILYINDIFKNWNFQAISSTESVCKIHCDVVVFFWLLLILPITSLKAFYYRACQRQQQQHAQQQQQHTRQQHTAPSADIDNEMWAHRACISTRCRFHSAGKLRVKNDFPSLTLCPFGFPFLFLLFFVQTVKRAWTLTTSPQMKVCH